MLGSIERDIQVLNDDGLVDGYILTIKLTLYLLIIPALLNTLDEQSATDLRQWVGHVFRHGDAALVLIHGQLVLLSQEGPLAHPE